MIVASCGRAGDDSPGAIAGNLRHGPRFSLTGFRRPAFAECREALGSPVETERSEVGYGRQGVSRLRPGGARRRLQRPRDGRFRRHDRDVGSGSRGGPQGAGLRPGQVLRTVRYGSAGRLPRREQGRPDAPVHPWRLLARADQGGAQLRRRRSGAGGRNGRGQLLRPCAPKSRWTRLSNNAGRPSSGAGTMRRTTVRTGTASSSPAIPPAAISPP